MRDLLVFAALVGGVPLAAFLAALWVTAAAPLGPPRGHRLRRPY